jgi:hypothetical protein
MTRRVEPDITFTIAGIDDPFLGSRWSPYLLALAELGPVDRRCVARQAAILAAALDVTVLDALELLGRIGILLNKDLVFRS